jgi:hypothetical protein
MQKFPRNPLLQTRNQWQRFFARVSTWFALNIIFFIALLIYHFLITSKEQKLWNDIFSILTNLLSGGLVSFLFYYLVVYIPEKEKKKLIKENLQRTYVRIKEDIIVSIVFASQKGGRYDLEASSDEIQLMMSPLGFKSRFENGRESTEGFYAFSNQMSHDTYEYRQILLSLSMISIQIEFVLNNFVFENPDLFDLFKKLELILIRLRSSGPGYDESKPLCRFIWEIFAGWDPIDGYVGFDRIQKAIAEL